MYYNKLMDDPPISGKIKRLFPCSNSNTWFDLCPLPFATAVWVTKSGGRSQGQFTAQWLCAAEQGYCEHCDCCATDHGTSCSCCEAPGHERESTLHHLRHGTTRRTRASTVYVKQYVLRKYNKPCGDQLGPIS